MMTLRRLLFCLLPLACLLACLPAQSARAATDTVTSTADDGSAGTLRVVLQNASPGDTIVFASGVSGTITLASTLTISQAVTIQGPGAASLALSGPGGGGTFADVEISATSGTVALSSLTIDNGNNQSINTSGSPNNSGGGVLVDPGASVSLSGCTLTGNSAGYAGGGLYNAGTATLTGCTVSGNVSYFAGGGIYSTGTLTLTDCFLTGNAVYSPSYNSYIQAGGMYSAGTLTMVNCVFSGNDGYYDGAGLVNTGAAIITGSSFTANQSGGIDNYSLSNVPAASLTLTNDIFYGDGGTETASSGTATATASYCDIGDTLGPASGGDGVTDGGSNINVNPAFENSPTNLQIGRISPCLGAGTASAPDYLNTDITGATRTDPPAIGAYDAAAVDMGSTADSLTLASSAPNTTFGQPATVTATVVPVNSGGVQPLGTVTFTVNGTAGSPVTVTNGIATLDVSAYTPGTYSLSAAYSGDANYVASSTTSNITQTVTQATPTITFTEAPNPATTGQYFTLTATVTPPAGQAAGTPAPTGDVTINGYQATLSSSGVATLQQSYSQPQTITATAVYNGDTNYTTATATPVQFSVTGNDITGTSITVSSSAEPAPVGQDVTFTATLYLSYIPSGTPAPTGTITFIVDPSTSSTVTSSPVAISEVNGTYQAQYTATGLTAGQHQIEANYSGDSYYSGSGTGTQLQAVYSGTTPTTTTITGSSTVAYGAASNLTVTVSPAPPGGFGSSDNIIFTVDGQQSQFDNSLTNGTTTYSTSGLTPGPHTISAIFTGDSTYAGSASSTFNLTVTGGVYTPTITVTSSANPSTPGQAVTFNASVFAYAGAPTATGTIQFYLNDSETPFDTETLVDGQATSAAQTFTATGSDTIYAVYSGDANDNPNSGSFTQTVSSAINTGGNPAATTLTAEATPTAVTTAQSVTLTASVSPATAAGTVTFTLTPASGTAVTQTASVTGGVATTTVAVGTLSAGTYTLTAAFTPTDATADTSSSASGGTVTVSTAPPTVINTFQPGLQMACLTETYTNFAAALNGTGTPPAYDTYNGTNYVLTQSSASEAAPAPGTAFWIAPGSAVSIYDTGSNVGTVSIPLHQGWNLIGDPFSSAFPLSAISVNGVSGLTAANAAALLYGTLYTWGTGNTTGYTVMDGTASGASLSPFTGYWLYAFQSGETLTMTQPEGEDKR